MQLKHFLTRDNFSCINLLFNFQISQQRFFAVCPVFQKLVKTLEPREGFLNSSMEHPAGFKPAIMELQSIALINLATGAKTKCFISIAKKQYVLLYYRISIVSFVGSSGFFVEMIMYSNPFLILDLILERSNSLSFNANLELTEYSLFVRLSFVLPSIAI